MKKDNLKRFKVLASYPNLLNEAMVKALEFDQNKIEYNALSKTAFLKIAEDPENEKQYALYLFLMFEKRANAKLPELIYYFRTLNKGETEYTSKTMYNREEAKQYIPKDILGKGIISDKINLMFKELIAMDKPVEFTMATFEKLDGNSLKRFEKLIDIIKNSGYYLTHSGINPENKNFWTFTSHFKSQLPLTEEEINKLGCRTQEEWDEIGNRCGLIEYRKEQKKNNI